MTRQLASLIVCSGFAALASACATKGFVQEQVGVTETKLTQRVDIQDTKLRESSDRAAASRQAIEGADQRLTGLDRRVDEVGALASDARTQANIAVESAHDAEARLSQRFADRNRYRLVQTRFIYFDSDQAQIRDDAINELEDVAKVLRADPNAILELQGFADPRGSDRHNYQLARDRVEAVTRYLVQRHDIELRQIRAIAMGKTTLVASDSAGKEAFARTRRVDIRLLAPWSSWEDAQLQIDQTGSALPAAAATPAPLESAQPTPAETVVVPAQREPTQPTQAATVVPPPPAGAAPPPSTVPNQPSTPKPTDVPPAELTVPSIAVKPGKPLTDFLMSISPGDLGGKE
jgi:outer membrane protein OmpA-like peptidoglycan-associated protein